MGEIFLVDSYSETNKDSNHNLDASTRTYRGQSFTGQAGKIVSCKFYLQKVGSPTGNIVAKLYSHSGAYGISSVGDSLLATSDNCDVSTISTSYGLITFTFSGANQYEIETGTRYCIVVNYAGGDSSNQIHVGYDASSPSHGGNQFYSTDGSSWTAENNRDICFYVRAEELAPPVPPAEPVEGEPIVPLPVPDVLNIADPITLKRTKEINGAWYIDMTCLPNTEISHEKYIDVLGEEYIIKKYEQSHTGSIAYNVTAYHNFVELGEDTIERFYRTDTVENLLAYILDGSYWTPGDCDMGQTLVFHIDKRMTRLAALNQLAEQCGGELNWHSKTRVVDLIQEIGTQTGLPIRVDKNATSIRRTVDSLDLVTRLYCYGPDGFEVNSTVIDNCEDETLWAGSGSLTIVGSPEFKQQGSQAIKIIATALNETATRDLGAGNVIDLSGHDSFKFRIYSETANASGITFGFGESAYTENQFNTGALEAGCWYDLEYNISAVADADKDGTRYLGFKNLTDGAATVIVDNIRAFNGNIYIDSPNISLYKYIKEDTYLHTAKVEKTVHEIIIPCSADTYVAQNKPNTNYGAAATLKIRDYSSGDYLSFIKFLTSQIPTGATITEALLQVTVEATEFSSGGTADIQLPDAAWGEFTTTYNNRPGSDGKEAELDGNSTGLKEIDITTTVQDWFSGAEDNLGLRFELNIDDTNKTITLSSKEGTSPPTLKVKYTTLTDPTSVIISDATEHLSTVDEPKVFIAGSIVDLSKTMADTWADEVIGLGDTLRAYVVEFNLNTGVRVLKITEDLLGTDIVLELGNKAYTSVDMDVKRMKQLSYAMPFNNNLKVVDAAAVQVGYLGSDVNV